MAESVIAHFPISPISPSGAARLMDDGGQRWRNPIRMVFVWLSRIWSLLNSLSEKLDRISRAVETPGPKGLNPEAWVGLRPASAKAYSEAVRAFVVWAERQRLPLEFPAEIDRAVVSFGRETHLTRGQRETFAAVCLGPTRRSIICCAIFHRSTKYR